MEQGNLATISILALLFTAQIGTSKAQFSDTAIVFCVTCDFPRFVEMDQQPGSDLLVEQSDSVFYAPNDGTGNFLAPVFVTTKPPGSAVVVVEDVDNDQDMDLIIGHQSMLYLLRHDQNSYQAVLLDTAFYYNSLYSYSGSMRNGVVLSAYVDEDAHKDIQLRSLQYDQFVHYRNLGNGTYEKHVDTIPGPSPEAEVVTYDWDGDGYKDLISGDMYASFGSANGVWNTPWVELYQGNGASRWLVADMDHNGYEDLIGSWRWYMRDVDSLRVEHNEQSNGVAFRIAADLDCDADLETFNWNATAGWVYMSMEDLRDDTLQTPYVLNLSNPYVQWIELDMGDVNGDGYFDIVYAPEINWLPGDTVLVRYNTAGVGPQVSLDLPFTTVQPGAVIALSGGLPLGGSYSGPGVVNDTLFADLAGPGPITISYTVVDTNGCVGRAIDAVDLVTGLGTNALIEARVYPNPAQDELFIRSGKAFCGSFQLLTGTGRLVDQGRLCSQAGQLTRLDLSTVASGVYLLRITEPGKGEGAYRVMVQ
ncbi:MAG: T9SS type A sorting domain-containing protein [Flavobacteriales bacterium]|nr:T9SS type A sorting domain-containing protein [Flavobacteriales bacterium]